MCKNSYNLLGHTQAINSAHFSMGPPSYVITAADDATARIWGMENEKIGGPLLVLDHILGTFKHGNAKSRSNKPLGPIKQAKFYYMDKFVLLASGPKLCLYKYLIEDQKDDLKRLINPNKYKLVQSFEQESKIITNFSCVNSFLSNIVLVCGSAKDLSAYDMNVGKCVRVIEEIHSKPAHTVRINEASPHVTHTGSAYDLFLTSATDSCVKLWDLRSNKCCKRFEGHQNRIHNIGCAFSPCMRYIATGSEDRHGYIYEMRTGTYVKKLALHGEVVSDVDFHPTSPYMVTSCFDGKIRFFSDQTAQP